MNQPDQSVFEKLFAAPIEDVWDTYMKTAR